MTGLTIAKAYSMTIVELARIACNPSMSLEDRATAADAVRAKTPALMKSNREWLSLTFAEKKMVRDAASYAGTNNNVTGA